MEWGLPVLGGTMVVIGFLLGYSFASVRLYVAPEKPNVPNPSRDVLVTSSAINRLSMNVEALRGDVTSLARYVHFSLERKEDTHAAPLALKASSPTRGSGDPA